MLSGVNSGQKPLAAEKKKSKEKEASAKFAYGRLRAQTTEFYNSQTAQDPRVLPEKPCCCWGMDKETTKMQ